MGRFSRSWALMKAAWSVLQHDKELLVLPVLSGAVSLVVMATFAVPIYLTGSTADMADNSTSFSMGVAGWFVVFLLYFVLAYVTIFFNTGLVCAADERMRGGSPTLGSALRGAASRAGAILPWALISATVSMVLRSLEQRGGIVGRLVMGLAGMAWSLITFLVLPILVLEGVGVGTAIKRSGELFKRTWGENVIANAAFGLFGFLAILITVPLIMAAVATGFAPTIIGVVSICLVWVLLVAVVLSALGVVYQVALYRFATDGTAPPAFAGLDLAGAFSPKKR